MKIAFKNVTKSFWQGKNKIDVLKSIDLEMESGLSWALCGKSGSGKTTMLSLLAGLEKVDSGQLRVGDTDLALLEEDGLCDYRASQLGIIFQQFNLLPHLTALENVLLPLEIRNMGPKGNLEMAREWLALTGLSDRETHFPSQLSGGEQQRVAIARALILKPPLILADEPTGNLDQETGKKIIELLFGIVKQFKLSLILVTHDEDLARKADRIVRINQGKCEL